MAITEREDYVPLPPPNQMAPAVREYLDTELRRIADLINERVLFTQPLAEAPARPVNGVIAYADGTNWNPGSGEGFYGYENGSWVKL